MLSTHISRQACIRHCRRVTSVLPLFRARNTRQWQQLCSTQLLRRATSTSAIAAAGAKLRLDRLLSDFSNVAIYNVGTVRTTIAGFSRVLTIFFMLYGSVVVAPAYFLNPEVSAWWTPAIMAGSCVPFLVTALAAAPYVNRIRIILPLDVKKSKEVFAAFVKNVPQDTMLSISTMKFLPWPTTQKVSFGQLRRLEKTKRWQGANLEMLSEDLEQPKSMLWKRMHAKLYVDRTQSKDHSQAPGAMNTLWEQIPMLGQASQAPATYLRPEPPRHETVLPDNYNKAAFRVPPVKHSSASQSPKARPAAKSRKKRKS